MQATTYKAQKALSDLCDLYKQRDEILDRLYKNLHVYSKYNRSVIAQECDSLLIAYEGILRTIASEQVSIQDKYEEVVEAIKEENSKRG